MAETRRKKPKNHVNIMAWVKFIAGTVRQYLYKEDSKKELILFLAVIGIMLVLLLFNIYFSGN